MAFKLPTLSDVQCALPPCDLQSFDYSEIDNQKLIGHGGFGIVYKATHEVEKTESNNNRAQIVDNRVKNTSGLHKHCSPKHWLSQGCV